jgi:membrane-bound inhibitor of C-type lysozyme
MSYNKLQGFQALEVYKSDNANVPYAEPVVTGEASATVANKLKIETTVDTGTTTSTVANKLVDSGQNFLTTVKVGMRVNMTSGTIDTALVTFVEDNNTLVLDKDIAVSGQTFRVESEEGFVTKRVMIGDIVYNTTDGEAATVILVDDNETLTLNANIMASGEDFIVYSASPQKGVENANNGCVLYLGDTDGNLKVTTVAGNIVEFKGLKAGAFFPVQIIKVHETGTSLTNIIALW